jgi:hypothetical protein
MPIGSGLPSSLAAGRGKIEVPDETTINMITDVALFEPNQRGTRIYDRFLASDTAKLTAADGQLAHTMASAWFSIFRVAGRHPSGGVWVRDLLEDRGPIWLLDEGLEASASEDMRLGIRIFDTGDFHAGLGIVVPAGEVITHFCVEARRRGDRLPVRNSLAAHLYADAIWGPVLADIEDEFLDEVLGEGRHGRD